MGDGYGGLFEPELMLYIDGKPAADKKIYISRDDSFTASDSDSLYPDSDIIPIINDLGLDDEDIEAAEAEVVYWYYWTEELPETDADGNAYEYSVRAVDSKTASPSNATGSNAGKENKASDSNAGDGRMPEDWELFYLDSDGSVIGSSGEWTTDAQHLTYVKKGTIRGDFEGEHINAILPERVPLIISAVNEDDADYLDLAEGWIDTGAGSWTISDALLYNPQTGEPIEWRAQAKSGAAYSFTYLNDNEYELEDEYVYAGGTIVSTDNTYSATGTIVWDDADNWHGKRPEDTSFIKIQNGAGTDVSSLIDVEIIKRGDGSYIYELNGLFVSESYTVSIGNSYYRVETAEIPEAEKDETASVETLTAKVITSRYYGSIVWESDSVVVKRPTTLDFLRIFGGDTEVTPFIDVKLLGISSDNKTWNYSIDGLVTGTLYQLQVEPPAGYASDIITCSIGYMKRSNLRTALADQITPIQMSGSTIDQAFVAIITAEYDSGGIKKITPVGAAMEFNLNSSFSTPVGKTGETYPYIVQITGDTSFFEFSLPDNAEKVRAGDADAGRYLNWMRIPIAVNDGEDAKFIYYSKEKNQIGYTIKDGDSINTQLAFVSKNGETPNGIGLKLIPGLAEDVTPPEDWKKLFTPDENTVSAVFEWSPVKKTALSPVESEGLGDILAKPGYPDLKYQINANNAQGVVREGIIFTDEYTLTDTLTLTNMYIDLSQGGTLAQGSGDDRNKLILTVDGNKYTVFSLAGAYDQYATIGITPTVVSNRVKEIKITYNLKRNDNTKTTNDDMVNLSLDAVFHYGTLMEDPGIASKFVVEKSVNDMYAVTNKVDFEAKSHFYDESLPSDSDYNKNHYHLSDSQVKHTASGGHMLDKIGYSYKGDLANLEEAVEKGNEVQLDAEYGNYMYYTITYRNMTEFMEQIYISDALVSQTNSGTKYFDLTKLEVMSVKVNGTAVPGKTWVVDTDKEYTADNCKGLVDYINLDYSEKGSAYKYVSMYMGFDNVGIGDEIQIIYRVKLLSSDAEGVNANNNYGYYGYNGALVSKTVPVNGKVNSVLVEDYTKFYLSPAGGRVALTKYAYDPNRGWADLETIDTGGSLVFGVYIKNPSNVETLSFQRLVEVWPFDGIDLTSLSVSDLFDENSATRGESQKEEMQTTYKITFYKQVGEIDKGGITDDVEMASLTGNTMMCEGVPVTDTSIFIEKLATLGLNYFTVTKTDGSPITIKPGNQLKFFFHGTVRAASDVKNEVWLEYKKDEGPGESAKVDVGVSALAVTTEKEAYLVSAEEYEQSVADAGGDYRTVSELGTLSDTYEVGDYVRYQITVTNSSYNESMKWVYVADRIPKLFSKYGEMPAAIYYEDYDPNHKVTKLDKIETYTGWGNWNIPSINQIYSGGFAGGMITAGDLRPYEHMEGTGYRGGGDGNINLLADIYLYLQALKDTNGDPLDLPSKSSVKFHVYFKVTDKVLRSSLEQTTPSAAARDNAIVSIAGNDLDNNMSASYDRDNVRIQVIPTDNERNIDVIKVPYAVIKDEAGMTITDPYYNNVHRRITVTDPDEVLLQKNGDILSAKNDDYIVYQLRLSDKTGEVAHKEGQTVMVYSFWDKIPEGTDFVGFINMKPAFPTNVAPLHDDCRIYVKGFYNNPADEIDTFRVEFDYQTYSTAAGSYQERGLKATSVSFDPDTGIATANFLPYEIEWSSYEADPKPGIISTYVIVKVTDASKVFVDGKMGGFDNVGGFVTGPAKVYENGTIQEDAEYEDAGYQLTVDDTTVPGPVYYPGITKEATDYRANSGAAWLKMPASKGIEPSSQVMWQIDLQNDSLTIPEGLSEAEIEDYIRKNARSAGDINRYMLTDVLPKGLALEKAYLLIGSEEIDLTSSGTSVKSDEDGSTSITWEVDTTKTGYENAAIPKGKSIKLVVITKWDTTVNTSGIYGNYENRIYLELDEAYPLDSRNVIAGEYDRAQTIYNKAIVNMMGKFSTSAYKTIRNVTVASPYEDDYATAYNYPKNASDGVPTDDDYIYAVVSDTVKYTLTVMNTGENIMQDLVIIDVLPHVGDSGVVNASQPRDSDFAVLFADEINLNVSLVDADGTETTIPSSNYTVSYTMVSGKTMLEEIDWTGGNGQYVTWNPALNQSHNAIRIDFADTYQITVDQTVKVTFDAKVPSALYEEELPDMDAIAWNSFGYRYKSGERELYAEPIRVGVKVPYSTIDVSKKVVGSDNKEIDSNTTKFMFLLEYSKTGADGTWFPATGISYSVDGEELVEGKVPVHLTGETDGKFELIAGGKIKLYVPAGSYYRVTEVDVPGGYELVSGELEMKAAAVSNQENSVEFVNKVVSGPLFPETGGIGTLPFTIGGMSIMLFGFLVYRYLMQRRERRRV